MLYDGELTSTSKAFPAEHNPGGRLLPTSDAPRTRERFGDIWIVRTSAYPTAPVGMSADSTRRMTSPAQRVRTWFGSQEW